MASVPWPIDRLNEIQVGSRLDDLLVRRFNLHRDKDDLDDDDDSCERWASPENEVAVILDNGIIGMVSHRDVACVGDRDLIDMDKLHVADVIGPPDRVDSIVGNWIYESQEWRLELGFLDGRVSNVTLSNGELFDD